MRCTLVWIALWWPWCEGVLRSMRARMCVGVTAVVLAVWARARPAQCIVCGHWCSDAAAKSLLCAARYVRSAVVLACCGACIVVVQVR